MRSTASSQDVSNLIRFWGRWFNVDPRLAKAVFSVESGLDPNIADSPAGAQGIAQILPATQRALGIANPYDLNESIRGGIQYLRQGYDSAIAAGHLNPAAAAVRHYNPLGGSDYLLNVAARYAALPDEQAAVAGGAAPGAVTGTALPGARFGVSPEVMNYPALSPGAAFNRVDPRLVDVVSSASGFLPDGWRAEMISGYRPGDPRLHGAAKALDVQLYGGDGRAIPNYQDGASFRTYEQFAQIARKIQADRYPELNGAFQWGGYFWNGGKPNYGASDLMHFDLGGLRGQAGDWENGLNAQGRAGGFDAGGPPSQGMGDIAHYRPPAGPGNFAVAAHSSGVGVTAVSLPDGVSDATAWRPPPGVQIASADAPVPAQQLPPVAHYQPTGWPQGAPASMAEAPPSVFANVAGVTPEQAALWRRASTPAGYAALQALANAPVNVGAGVAATPVERVPLAPPVIGAAPAMATDLEPQRGRVLGAGPLGAGPLSSAAAPPDLEPQRARALGVGPLPAAISAPWTPGGPLPTVGTGLAPPVPGYGAPAPGSSANPPAISLGGQGMPPPIVAQRALSDADIARMGPTEAALAGLRNDLTDADRMALIGQLSQYQQQQQMW
jgi:hypothetical protein